MTAGNPLLALAAPAVSGLSPYQPGKPVAELEREYGVRNAIKLASNENPWGAAPAVRDAVAIAVKDIASYPDGVGYALRAALSHHHRVTQEQITLGNGSNDLLVLLAETFLHEHAAAVYDQHSFIVYRLAVQACGATAQVAPSLPVEADAQPLGHDLEAMLDRVTGATRLVFIANPNNPTGTWVDAASLRSFLAALPTHVIAVLDEAYFDYARGEDGADAIDWLPEFPNLVVVRTFSKAYGLAGLRVGYCISHPAIAELLNRVRQPFNVNSLAQIAALTALATQDWVTRCVVANRLGREQLCAMLTELGYPALKSNANFLLTDFGSESNAIACNEFLLRGGVIVRPVANYGLSRFLRITVGTPPEVDRLMQRLRAFRPVMP